MAALGVAAVLVAGCGGSGAHHHDAASGTTAASGTGCISALTRATRATLAASSLTVTQDPWRERPVDPAVAGGASEVITYQAPDRYHVVPRPAAGGGRPLPEQIFVGHRAWQGSSRTGWVEYTTAQPPDVLRWLAVPGTARVATWTGSRCAFSAKVAEGRVSGQAAVDGGTISSLTMTLEAGRSTIDMSYGVTRVGASPPVGPPRPAAPARSTSTST
jgi:hypothetical protein